LNYLVHLFLAEPTPENLLGNLMGDFVKGRLDDAFPPGIRRGIELHRRIDSLAQRSPACRRSRTLIDPAFGHLRGIMVDIFYDHFLARNWSRHHPRPLEAFAREVYTLLEENFSRLPAGLQQVAPRMITHDWLVSYREPAVIGRVLQRIGTRLSRPNPLAHGVGELHRHYAELEADCNAFLAEAQAFVRAWRQKSP
jgi:acyl carrier protein phosphodiesterase